MQSIMSNIFNLLENFVDIIDNKYSLIIGAKYHSSNMNDACTIVIFNMTTISISLKQFVNIFYHRICNFFVKLNL